jgi:carboxymethylenebutenolidase
MISEAGTNPEGKLSGRPMHIQTPDGVAVAYLFVPQGSGPWPGILYYPDGLGVRPAYDVMAGRLAAEGYVVLLPNIYYRTTSGPAFGRPVDIFQPEMHPRFTELTAPLTPSAMERDALAYLDFLSSRPEVDGPMGVVGYCVTGKMALRTAAIAPNRIAAAAAFCGDKLYTDDPGSPHLVLPRVTARLYFGHATNDIYMPAEQIVKFESALASWGGMYVSETYPAQHGWAVPGREIYNEREAERHFSNLQTLFSESLQ